MEQQSLYSEFPLNYVKKAIRLLRILPGEWHDAIECQMEVVLLTEKPTYFALSYVWGTLPTNRIIQVHGHAYHIKPNLFTALRRIRELAKGDMRALWIDALCIDQANDQERNHQVGLMSDIYSNCFKCYIWLGELEKTMDSQLDCDLQPSVDFDSSNSAGIHSKPWARLLAENKQILDMESEKSHWDLAQSSSDSNKLYGKLRYFLSERAVHASTALRLLGEGHCLSSLSHPALFPHDDFSWMALKFFMQKNQWFNRLWVVQEATLANEVAVLFGPVSLPLESIYSEEDHLGSLSVYGRSCTCSSEVQLLYNIFEIFRSIIYARRDFRQPSRAISLAKQRLKFYGLSATEHVDHIYGILSLCPRDEAYHDTIQPEYGILPHVLYTNVSRNEISRYRSLWPLIYSPIKAKHLETPSWAIDWTAFPRTRELEDLHWKSMFHDSAACQGINADGDSIEFLGGHLRVKGILVDRISSSVQLRDPSKSEASDGRHNPNLENMSYLVSKRFFPLDPYTADKTITFYEAWLRTLTANIQIDGRYKHKRNTSTTSEFWTKNIFTFGHKESHKNFPMLSSGQCAILGETMRILVWFYNSMFMTTKGYLGIAKGQPDSNGKIDDNPAEGDSIFILAGGNTPFVLRKITPSSDQDRTDENITWKLIGPCYLHGFMNGEHTEELIKQAGGLETITIV